MNRGEIWTQSSGSGYARKPRPVLIVQSDGLIGTESIIICLFTSHEGGTLTSRLLFEPTEANGLLEASDLMADKIMTVPRTKLGRKIGAATAEDMDRVEQGLAIVLGFAG